MCVCARIYARWCDFCCYGSYWYYASLQVEVLFILACYSLPLRPILEWSDILGLIICQRIQKLLNVFYDLSRNHTPFYSQIMGICSSWCGYDMNKMAVLSHWIFSSHRCIHVFILSPILLCCRFDLTWIFRFWIQSSASKKSLTLLQSLKWNCVLSGSLISVIYK